MGGTIRVPGGVVASIALGAPVKSLVGAGSRASLKKAAGNGLARERVIDIQRARILAAMVEVSGEYGSANVTVAHVVERAGVSRRTFYELFTDREECFLAAFDDAVGRITRYVLDVYDPSSKWAERVRHGLIAALTFLDGERDVGRLMVVGSLGAGRRAFERRRQIIAEMIALVEGGAREAKGGAETPPLVAEGIVGGVLSVLHSRLIDLDGDSLVALAGPLMSMIVLPYLGPAAARRELTRVLAIPADRPKQAPADPLRDVHMRLTYRTVCVLMGVADHPGSSNREIGLAAGIQDQGQMSKLLTRLHRLGLIENTEAGLARGAPNAWMLTSKGQEIEHAVRRDTNS